MPVRECLQFPPGQCIAKRQPAVSKTGAVNAVNLFMGGTPPILLMRTAPAQQITVGSQMNKWIHLFQANNTIRHVPDKCLTVSFAFKKADAQGVVRTQLTA